jgi:hypothetical protein
MSNSAENVKLCGLWSTLPSSRGRVRTHVMIVFGLRWALTGRGAKHAKTCSVQSYALICIPVFSCSLAGKGSRQLTITLDGDIHHDGGETSPLQHITRACAGNLLVFLLWSVCTSLPIWLICFSVFVRAMFVIMFYKVFICFSCFCFMFYMIYSELFVRQLRGIG